MKPHLIEWLNELRALDSSANLLTTIDEVEFTFLESHAADDQQLRMRVLILLRHLKKIL